MTAGGGLGGRRADWVDPRYGELAEHVDREISRAFRRPDPTPCPECGALGVHVLLTEGTRGPVSVPCLAC
ncbi:hypothetical protein ACWD4V_04305 [Streptomyces tsukubensis]|uniref:hypothetical protein n=1 Tax=Streptomyces tsukubensis TaxID=83656 RepID=UPI0036C483A9